MKNLILIITVLIFLLGFGNLLAYDTTTAKYMPLQIGNIWVYNSEGYGYPYYGLWYNKYKISGTFDTLGHRYYIFNVTNVFISGLNNYPIGPALSKMRIDSSSMKLLQPLNACGKNEETYDSLLSKVNDSVWICRSTGSFAQCRDTLVYEIFGTVFSSKHTTRMISPESSEEKKYAKDIGLVFDNFIGMGFGWSSNLRGCVINGVLRGDTNMVVGFTQISSEIPKSFSLSQNYPNPFNPSTAIKFEIPTPPHPLPEGEGRIIGTSQHVSLRVYDILGREVATLVNQQMQPGSYSVIWDGTNYSSGVYFYKLIVGDNTNKGGDFVQTKKMVLIK